MKKSVGTVITALIAISIVCTPISIQAANAPEWFDDINDNYSYPARYELVIKDCWDTSIPTNLLVKWYGKWVKAAKSSVKRNTRSCSTRSHPYLHTYQWRVTEEATDSNDQIWLAISDNTKPKYKNHIDFNRPTAPTPTPGPASATPTPSVAAPAPTVPTPTPTPSVTPPRTSIDTAYLNRLLDLAKAAPDSQLKRCLTLANQNFDTDSKDFYELGAWTGQQLYKLPRDVALVTTKFAYAVYCNGAFGITTRIL